jgi:hypothetical protein
MYYINRRLKWEKKNNDKKRETEFLLCLPATDSSFISLTKDQKAC